MSNLELLTQFVLLTYARYSLQARISTGVPRQDIFFIYELKMYCRVLLCDFKTKIVDEAQRLKTSLLPVC